MRQNSRTGTRVLSLGLPALMVLAAGSASAPAARGADIVRLAQAASLAATGGGLSGVSATSAGGAWAVGATSSHQTLVERWSGTRWQRVPSPTPAGGGGLQAVATTSTGDAWAVGFTGTVSPQPLILRWHAGRWRQERSPRIAGGGYLYGITAASASTMWAAGYTADGKTLVERWDGSSWRRVASPSPAGFDVLYSVASDSGGSVWTAGHHGLNLLIEHWNGKGWSVVTVPHLTGTVTSVAVSSAHRLWAVGYQTGIVPRTLILRWNGRAWTKVASPTPVLGGGLNGVAATSAKNAWAVGYGIIGGVPLALALHWNGGAWTTVRVPHPGTNSGLAAVTAAARPRAWAVGGSSYPSSNILIAGSPSGAGFALATAQQATNGRARSPQASTVNLTGPVSCAGLYPPPSLNPEHFLVSRIRFVTANGEGIDATISGLSYSVSFSNVPAGGETAIGYVTCQGDTLPSWGCQFTLQQNPQTQVLNMLIHLLAGNYAVDGNC